MPALGRTTSSDGAGTSGVFHRSMATTFARMEDALDFYADPRDPRCPEVCVNAPANPGGSGCRCIVTKERLKTEIAAWETPQKRGSNGCPQPKRSRPNGSQSHNHCATVLGAFLPLGRHLGLPVAMLAGSLVEGSQVASFGPSQFRISRTSWIGGDCDKQCGNVAVWA
jgi:hypothetical protein